MIEEFQRVARAIYRTARREGRLVSNPDNEELRKLALQEPEVRQTKFGSLATDTEPLSRAAMFTANNIGAALFFLFAIEFE